VIESARFKGALQHCEVPRSDLSKHNEVWFQYVDFVHDQRYPFTAAIQDIPGEEPKVSVIRRHLRSLQVLAALFDFVATASIRSSAILAR
jgi:hypothetical protein